MECNAADKPALPLFLCAVGCCTDLSTDKPADDNRKNHEEDEDRLPPGIEQETSK